MLNLKVNFKVKPRLNIQKVETKLNLKVKIKQKNKKVKLGG
jgi:hypothetical protein